MEQLSVLASLHHAQSLNVRIMVAAANNCLVEARLLVLVGEH